MKHIRVLHRIGATKGMPHFTAAASIGPLPTVHTEYRSSEIDQSLYDFWIVSYVSLSSSSDERFRATPSMMIRRLLQQNTKKPHLQPTHQQRFGNLVV
jgi:hypothetical protein